jgi:CxxC motif-containing protein (DUF1111 family)
MRRLPPRVDQTGPSAVAALNRVTFHPYSDFLLHDIGSIGDGISQGQASGREMRTAPLWGLRNAASLLHDGSARTIEQAIQRHDGQARAARERFSALDAASSARAADVSQIVVRRQRRAMKASTADQ